MRRVHAPHHLVIHIVLLIRHHAYPFLHLQVQLRITAEGPVFTLADQVRRIIGLLRVQVVNPVQV